MVERPPHAAVARPDDDDTARFERAADAVVDGDVATLRALLHEHPALARARSPRPHHATLLHYVAANGVEDERQRTPPNAVEVARVLLAAGAEPDALADAYGAPCTTLSLLVSSTPPAEAGVQGELVRVLLGHGAALAWPGSGSALTTALAFGFVSTAELLVEHGAPVDTLEAAAGLGRLDDAVRLLPRASATSRHTALALAARVGRADVVRLLLDAGEDPDRYNPPGYHAHSTPLHQAALAGHADVVRLLVERGARRDLADTVHQGTPLDWAEHGGQGAIAAYLRSARESPA